MHPLAVHIAGERADLLGVLGRVGGDAWRAPTCCPGWSVKDVVAHLVENELALGRVCRAERSEVSGDDAANEEGVERWRALPGVAVRSAFWQHGVAAQRLVESIPDDQWRRELAMDLQASGLRWSGTLRLGELLAMHFVDLCVHGHDLTDALGEPPVWGPRLGALCERLLRSLPATLSLRGVEPGGIVAIRGGEQVTTIGPDGGRWRRVEEEPVSRIAVGGEELILAVTGRLAPEKARAIAVVEGDEDLAGRVIEGWRLF